MSAQIIDGKEVAKSVRKSIKARIATLKEKGVTPGLATVLIGDDPASQTYVKSKVRMCEKLGLYSEAIGRPADIAQAELDEIVAQLNEAPNIHGILVQSPLPSHLDEPAVVKAIKPEKDVDGFHPYNVGLMLIGEPNVLPCTPHGIMKLLEYYDIDPAGKEAVIVGRSNIVGKPMAAILVQKAKMANATVTIAHSRSANLAEITRRADILVAAVGRPGTIDGSMIKEGAVVIDVGVNRIDDSNDPRGYRLVGDVDFDSCAARASWITPVPGGVGPLTIAMLMFNTVEAAERSISG
ncbi:MAG: bifunctional methylenetetrahydrofolate dehydrogenase/methenyltetrahydrofolate cyclohydrolase FolD [candidate division Zixibacteria bacterium]|nr:bifunctional methylenetetrahydrofolate dehydrogenase/methenyltetrahydrofolate cyclohydrolase FolD [candidate division Zixibacteria bacterium]